MALRDAFSGARTNSNSRTRSRSCGLRRGGKAGGGIVASLRAVARKWVGRVRVPWRETLRASIGTRGALLCPVPRITVAFDNPTLLVHCRQRLRGFNAASRLGEGRFPHHRGRPFLEGTRSSLPQPVAHRSGIRAVSATDRVADPAEAMGGLARPVLPDSSVRHRRSARGGRGWAESHESVDA